MTKWYIKIWLKSGNIISGSINSVHENSSSVARELFIGHNGKTNGIIGNDGDNLFFVVGEFEAFSISSSKFSTNE